MTIEKLPSGSYRIKQMENGKRYSVTVPYKPSKKQAWELIYDKINNSPVTSMPFKDAVDEYLKVKSNVLSPSTIRGYRSIMRNIPEWFNKMDISEIDRLACQRLVNEYALTHSAKSTINMNGFIQGVIHLYRPDLVISVTLPQKVRRNDYIPSYDDVTRILDALRDTDYYVPLYLATLSMRLSEICALTLDDLNGNIITVNKALIREESGYILKDMPKTDSSNREIVIPGELSDRIRNQGYVYKGYPNQILKALNRTTSKLGIPHFTVHKLRHFFASYSHDLGYSDAIIQSLGGWSSDHVMKSVYRHAMNKDQAKKSIADDFTF